MCPTFKATLDEQLCTRGRANALRAAISGRLDFDAPGVYDTLDLCVSCKACATECPSSVDMAKLKTEYLHQFYQRHRMPIRSRLFSHFDDIGSMSSGWQAPLVNAIASNKVLRGVVNGALGLAHQRPLPTFARHTFDDWAKRQVVPKTATRQVVLLVDVVHNHSHTEVAQAAFNVLHACGFEVVVAPEHDVGRPAFSKGDLPTARKKAIRALDVLTPYARKDLPIVGLEPSDVSMLIDDNRALLSNDMRVELIAAHSFTFEEFMWREMKAGTLEGRFSPQHGKILLHGHCHQKALIGTRYSEELLAFLGYEVEEAGSACCGMAGSFGYEAEHYELSMKMGELTLFPAVRAQEPNTLIVAAGVSCHEQIVHGTGRDALHPAVVLFQALAPSP